MIFGFCFLNVGALSLIYTLNDVILIEGCTSGNSPPDNRSTLCPIVSNDRLGDHAYSYITNGSNTHTNGMLLQFNMSTHGNNSNVLQ